MGLFDFNINPHVDVHINTEEIAGSNYKAKVLKPNLVDGVNTLAQEMIDECGANTVFVIKYDYQIDETIAFPENSVIHFDGGSFNGGTVVGNNTKVFNPYEAEAFNGTAKQGTFMDLSEVEWDEVKNKPVFATVATSGSYNDLKDKPSIPSGQMQSDWNQTNTSEVDYIKNKPTKLSDFADDSSFINGASYDSQNNRINFKHNDTVVAWIDAAPFIIDGMVSDVKIENGKLVIKFNTDAGKQNIEIPLTDIFNPNNYYTKAQVDTELGKKADASSLANVATSGNYNDLSNKPAIPVVPTKVSAFTNDAGYLTQHQDISGKQDKLVSGQNIKTINNQSLLGSGNINIEGGGGTVTQVKVGSAAYNPVNGVVSLPSYPSTLDDISDGNNRKLSNYLDVTSEVGRTVSGKLILNGGATIPSFEKLEILGDVESVKGFKKKDSSDDYVLLAGGGTKALSEIGPSEFNCVTLDSKQTITGEKWFSGVVRFLWNSDVQFDGSAKVGSGELYTMIEPRKIELHTIVSPSPRREATTIVDAEGITSPKFIVKNGTAAQFLKADGSVDENAYLIPGSRISLLGNDVGYLTSADLSDYAKTSDLSAYLPLSGGTMTGDLNMAGHKLYFGTGTSYINEYTIPGPHGTNMGHILNFYGVDGNGYYNFDNSVHATSFVKVGGTYAQFLKADGSVDGNAYLPLSGGTITGLLNVGGEPEGSEYGIYTPLDIYAVGGLNSGSAIYLLGTNVNQLAIRVEGLLRNSFGIDTEDSTLNNNYWETSRMKIGSKFKVGDATFYADAGTGKVGIGTSSPSYKLDVQGQVGATEFVTTSDETLKNKVGDVALSAEDIANAPAIKFTWKDEKKSQEVNVGTIAQYWQEVLPEVVSKDNDDKLGLNYPALATVSVISLAKEVVSLREKVSTLEERLAKLEQLMTNK